MLVSLKHGIKQTVLAEPDSLPVAKPTVSLLLGRKYIICIKVKSERTVLAFYIERLVFIENKQTVNIAR